MDLVAKMQRTIRGLIRVETFVKELEGVQSELPLFQSQLDFLKRLQTTFYDTREKLDSIEQEGLDRSVEEDAEILFAKLEGKLLLNIAKNTHLPSSVKDSPINDSSQLVNSHVTLPSIKIPVYEGDLSLWLHFRGLFEKLVIQNETLNDLQRFYYLNSFVSKDAKQVISNFPISGDNFSHAWSSLCERYDNTKLILKHHLDKLFSLPYVSERDSSSLRNLLTIAQSNVNAISALNLSTDLGDCIIQYMILNRLTPQMRMQWELKCNSKEVPSLKEFFKFLNNHSVALELQQSKGNKFVKSPVAKKPSVHVFQTSIEKCKPNPSSSKLSKCKPHSSNVTFSKPRNGNRNLNPFPNNPILCSLCEGSHMLYNCSRFKGLPVAARIAYVTENNFCMNCLQPNAADHRCSKRSCFHCKKPHHSTLHVNIDSDKGRTKFVTNSESPQQINGLLVNSKLSDNKGLQQAILPTATVLINKPESDLYKFTNVLIDSGSQINLISRELCEMLDLKIMPFSSHIGGINTTSSYCHGLVEAVISSRDLSWRKSITFHVVNTILNQYPIEPFSKEKFNIPKQYYLADQYYNVPKEINILIGADIFFEIIKGQKITLTSGAILLNTKLGYVISGRQFSSSASKSLCNLTIHESLKKFWEYDSLPSCVESQNSEDIFAETHFQATHKFLENKIHQVSLPFLHDKCNLGQSYNLAKNRFLSLERKFQRNPEYFVEYSQIIQDYIDKNQLQLILEPSSHSNNEFFIPHHSVRHSTSSKLRIVLDASMKSTSGYSLNDLLAKGPTVQQDLFSILLNFRLHEAALSADIKAMYHRIQMAPSDRRFQRILWRNNSKEDLKTYQFSNVIFGVKSSPFHATRTLHQIACDIKLSHPVISSIIDNNIYVDNLILSVQSKKEAMSIFKDISDIFMKNNFLFRQWSSNCSDILSIIPNELKHEPEIQFEEQSVNTLGILWSPKNDIFKFKNNCPSNHSMHSNALTRREALSRVASIFDCLGLIEPLKVKYKLFLQTIWTQTSSWDECLNSDLYNQWNKLHNELALLESLTFPRRVIKSDACHYNLIGFCDASPKAFGAVIYLQSITNHDISSSLLCSKSRLAPVAQTHSIPRLELSAMKLLSELFHKVMTSLQLSISCSYLFSDSAINLYRLNHCSSKFNQFIATRLDVIHALTDNQATWLHCPSLDNPADLLTREIAFKEFVNNTLWHQGPKWLLLHQTKWPNKFSFSQFQPQLLELKICCVTHSQHKHDQWFNELSQRFSNVNRLHRAIAFCFRFISNCKAKVNNTTLLLGPLSADEVYKGKMTCVKLTQDHFFSDVQRALTDNMPCPSDSNISCLFPFLDEMKILRVGGRLQNADITYNEKYPIILPYRCHYSYILVRNMHINSMHSEGQALTALIRQEFWIPSLKRLAKTITYQCVMCHKFKVKHSTQLMSHLPLSRVTVSPAFSSIGLDYCGPFMLKASLVRTKTMLKCYVAIFVCLTTKMVHFEIVTSLSTTDFLQTFTRFISRRGCPQVIYSDNQTSFHGSKNYMKELQAFLANEKTQTAFQDFLSIRNISWKFHIPKAPFRNALAECNVKSLKYYLRRNLGTKSLNFINFMTVITSAESFLNSRPLCAISADPNEVNVLTPYHLYTGHGLSHYAFNCNFSHPLDSSAHFQNLNQTLHYVWNKWKREYLLSLQQRTKWQFLESPLKIGDLVYLTDNSSPLCWELARISKVFPDSNNVVRSVEIITSRGTFQRAVQSLCPLPKPQPTA